MVASQVLMGDSGTLDSAGMLICGDGSSKQRGHGAAPGAFEEPGEVLLPSGSAALYRRRMLDETGGFDDDFFLYCEDTDLGLRARWAGWRCLYEPRAVVRHKYSHSSGRASALKAYYVERNRLFLLAKNFPLSVLWRAPIVSAARYWWHLRYMLAGRGAAAEFTRGESGAKLAWLVLRAHLALLGRLPRLLAARRSIRGAARISPADFVRLLERHSISAREVAAL
jgi:GT2 family glycosyltransferase